jgi:hypothetical protein
VLHIIDRVGCKPLKTSDSGFNARLLYFCSVTQVMCRMQEGDV